MNSLAGKQVPLLSTVTRRKVSWFVYVTRYNTIYRQHQTPSGKAPWSARHPGAQVKKNKTGKLMEPMQVCRPCYAQQKTNQAGVDYPSLWPSWSRVEVKYLVKFDIMYTSYIISNHKPFQWRQLCVRNVGLIRSTTSLLCMQPHHKYCIHLYPPTSIARYWFIQLNELTQISQASKRSEIIMSFRKTAFTRQRRQIALRSYIVTNTIPGFCSYTLSTQYKRP